MQDSAELRKIKKVQSFFRGWLCRRRWKQIVEEYIKSPHAESMRKRNSLVFSMVEAEEEYLEQLEVTFYLFFFDVKNIFLFFSRDFFDSHQKNFFIKGIETAVKDFYKISLIKFNCKKYYRDSSKRDYVSIDYIVESSV